MFSRQPRSVESASTSPLEITLIRGGSLLVHKFFDSWPSPIVYLFSTASFAAWSIVREYIAFRWDPRAVIARWFNDIDGFVSLMKKSQVIVCGPLVSQYFDRAQRFTENMDICVERGRFGQLLEYLGAEAYRYPRNAMFVSTFQPTISYHVRTFLFHKPAHRDLTISVHVVQGDPVEFILTCAASMSPTTLITDFTPDIHQLAS